MSFLPHCDQERELNLSDSHFSLVRFMRSLVSSVILFLLPSVALFGLSNLYVNTLLITVHCLWARSKRERQVQKQSSWKTVDLFHYLENVILALLRLTIDMHEIYWPGHKKHLVLLVQE